MTVGKQYDAICAVAGELLETLGSAGAPLAEGLLLRLGEMCAGASDAAEEGADEASDKVSLAAQNALGQGIKSMGPAAVLTVLPLGLVEVNPCTSLSHPPSLSYPLSSMHSFSGQHSVHDGNLLKRYPC